VASLAPQHGFPHRKCCNREMIEGPLTAYHFVVDYLNGKLCTHWRGSIVREYSPGMAKIWLMNGSVVRGERILPLQKKPNARQESEWVRRIA
jgi:hypothetical protein